MPAMSRYKGVATVALWLVLVVLAFYYFFWRYIQPFDHQRLYPDGQVNTQRLIDFVERQVLADSLPLSRYKDKTLVFHWLNPQCKCTVLSRLFIEKMSAETQSGQVKHIVLTPPQQSQALAEAFSLEQSVEVVPLEQTAYQGSMQLIPSTPAAIVYQQQTQSLSYFGPHSSGVVCGKGDSFVDLVLNNLAHGFDPKLVELKQSGCFCAW